MSTIIHIDKVMDIRTIADAVEDDDAILERITALGIDYAQGYGTTKPLANVERVSG